MIDPKDYASVQAQLQKYLAAAFESVTVQIGDGIHYPGTNVVVTAPQFAGLLPEQRYHHVVRAVPPEFYERYLRGGVVWFELAPGESGQDYMKLPRTEDIAGQEKAIHRQLARIRFFQKFQAALEQDPSRASIHDFTLAREVLRRGGLSEPDITRACLFLIRHGGYCDAHVQSDILPDPAGEHVRTKAT